VKPGEILQHVVEFYGDKARLLRRHEAVARVVGQYDLNNTYQYIIAREDQHLRWLADAIAAMGGALPPVPPADPPTAATDPAALQSLARDDANMLDGFVTAWRDRVASLTHARHRLVLELSLGETLEHARLFRQAAGGRLDLLGRRTGGERTPGVVLPKRWVE
jgi:hypothetical protein